MSKLNLNDKLNKLAKEVAVELALLKLDYNLEEVSLEVRLDSTGADLNSSYKGDFTDSISEEDLGNMAAEYLKEKQVIINQTQGIESAFPAEHG